MRLDLFVYDWHSRFGGGASDDDGASDNGEIVAYAMTAASETRVVHICGFEPWVHVEVMNAQTHVESQAVFKSIKENRNVAKVQRVMRTQLYGATAVEGSGAKQFLLVRFESTRRRAYFVAGLRKIGWRIVAGGKSFRVCVYDTQCSDVLQFTTQQAIAPTGWVTFVNAMLVSDGGRGHVVRVLARNVVACTDTAVEPRMPPVPRVLSYDIECFSSNPGRMPNAAVIEDRVFQIGISTSSGHHVLLTMWPSASTCNSEAAAPAAPVMLDVRTYATERDLLLGFVDAILEYDPHFLTGYNIFKFDLPYLIQRAKLNNVFAEFASHGVNGARAAERLVKWSSAAFATVELQFLDVPGRVSLDMLTVVQRDFKLDNYRLKTVATHFLGETKDPVTPQGIFAAYELLVRARETRATAYMDAAVYALHKVGRYCVQDATLVSSLFDHLQAFVGCVELSAVMHVPISVLFTRGQQIRIFSQVFRECYREKPRRIINRERDAPSEKTGKYEGAIVYEPTPGLYRNVVSLDFNSLYPTSQIAYNICPSTYVADTDPRADNECHVIDTSSHVGCEHDTNEKRRAKTKAADVLCVTGRARFAKTPEGVLPRLLRELLEARAATRKHLKAVAAADNKGLVEVLDKRQLALKISANSVYGSLGAAQGFIPFLVGAAATTAVGRASITKAIRVIETEYGGITRASDTDSTYVQFKAHEATPQELWDYCLRVEHEVSKLFPAPMYLEFEGAIYERFLIFAKKKYVCSKMDRDGAISDKLTVRGIVLTRRDNCAATRVLYKSVVLAIFNDATLTNVRDMVLEYVLAMLARQKPVDDFVITKAVCEPSEYTVRSLPDDAKKRAARLAELGCTEETYAERALPAHVQLMLRMRRRGSIFDAGQRLEHVVAHPHVASPLAAKLEDVEYFCRHRELLRIDYEHYVKFLANPIDQITTTIFGVKVVAPLHKVISNKRAVHEQLLNALIKLKLQK